MEPSMPLNDGGRIRVELPTKVPFAKKWDILKPVIKQIYVDENQKLPDLIEFMRQEYGFVAMEHDYKYHFKKWKMNKNISTPMKDKILKVREKHSQPGATTMIKYQGRNVEDKKLRRHLKEGMRRNVARGLTAATGGELKLLSGSALLVTNSVFLNWNIPYGTMRSSTAQVPSFAAPSPMSVSTPSDIEVTTGPINALSPNNAPSPISRDHSMKVAIDRANMLMGGQFHALVNSMRREEKNIMSIWLYQFWLHGFKTAKHWGRGPRKWTAELLGFNSLQATSPVPIPFTPGADFDMNLNDLISPPSHSSLLGISQSNTDLIHKPSQLCRWSIHYHDEIKYEQWKSRTPSPELDPDPSNEESWRPWSSSCEQPTYPETLLNNLAKNEFSDIETENLPIAVSRIAESSKNPKNVLLEEAIGFAIMARNRDVVKELSSEIDECSDEIRDAVLQLNPIHLATSYLDGSKTCCDILEAVLYGTGLQFRSKDRNNLGHTVVDNLMIAILKAHTSVEPGNVDESLKNEKRFAGEEVDICGRWDADSECVRNLLKAGDPSIPFAWKHKFCHTSVQVICHCIECICRFYTISRDRSPWDVPSGLFTKRCISCGLKMDLLPLHVLVLVGFGLAQFGAKDEDLFGVLAVLLTMLQAGADPLETADVSASALFSDETYEKNPEACNHRPLRPAELAGLVPPDLGNNWPEKAKVGWEILCHVLRSSEKVWRANDHPPSECYHDYFVHDEYVYGNFFGHNRDLAILAGATEAEYLTYRRLAEGDPWVSPNFDMNSILENMNNGDKVLIGLVENRMIQPVCDCGRLQIPRYLPSAKDVMRYHFSNLEDWSRTTFIAAPWDELADNDCVSLRKQASLLVTSL